MKTKCSGFASAFVIVTCASTGGRGGREESHLLPVQAEERDADGQTRAAPDRLCSRHRRVEPIHAETTGPDGGRAAGQLV